MTEEKIKEKIVSIGRYSIWCFFMGFVLSLLLLIFRKEQGTIAMISIMIMIVSIIGMYSFWRLIQHVNN